MTLGVNTGFDWWMGGRRGQRHDPTEQSLPDLPLHPHTGCRHSMLSPSISTPATSHSATGAQSESGQPTPGRPLRMLLAIRAASWTACAQNESTHIPIRQVQQERSSGWSCLPHCLTPPSLLTGSEDVSQKREESAARGQERRRGGENHDKRNP